MLLSCVDLLVSLLWEAVITCFHKCGFNEEGAFRGHTPPWVCACGFHVGGCGDVLSDPAFIPQAWSGSWFVELTLTKLRCC